MKTKMFIIRYIKSKIYHFQEQSYSINQFVTLWYTCCGENVDYLNCFKDRHLEFIMKVPLTEELYFITHSSCI